MTTSSTESEQLDPRETRDRIKGVIVREMLVEGLEVGEIEDDQLLFGEEDSLGLDSIDALQIVLGLEQEFSVKIDTNTLDRERLATVSGMADFVLELKGNDGAEKMRGHR